MPNCFRVSLPDGAHYEALDDENLLAAAQRAHWLVRFGCRNGNCDACGARLSKGAVRQHDGTVIDAPAAKILLCLCRPLGDIEISLPFDPRPGSADQALRSYARLQHQTLSAGESVLYFTLPAGRRPIVLADQIALIETDAGLLQGDIVHTASRDRELIVRLLFSSPLRVDAYYHVRYPLSAAHLQDSIDE